MNTPKNQPQRHEVIIVGGGLVGATAGCALAHGDIDVAVLDTVNPPRQWQADSVDLRVFALTQASINILQTLGVWQHMVELGVSPYKDMRVWDAQADGELHFDCADTQFNALGYIVENRVAVAALWDKLATLPSATCITSAKVAKMQLTENGRDIQLEDGRHFHADLVIAADGGDSMLRSMAGIVTRSWSYQQNSLVATITTENSHQCTAWQRFLDEGPLAFLPLRDGQSAIVWTLATDTANDYLQLNDSDFLQKLEQASAGILGRMLKIRAKGIFPLRFQYAKQYTDNHFALIGDAAHVMHPLAGQGANAGLLDAAALAELILKTKHAHKSLLSPKYLRQYERWRKGDNLQMMVSMDIIHKIFASRTLPLISLRSTGMNLINKTTPIKALFNNHAMGLRDDLPLLAKKRVCW